MASVQLLLGDGLELAEGSSRVALLVSKLSSLFLASSNEDASDNVKEFKAAAETRTEVEEDEEEEQEGFEELCGKYTGGCCC